MTYNNYTPYFPLPAVHTLLWQVLIAKLNVTQFKAHHFHPKISVCEQSVALSPGSFSFVYNIAKLHEGAWVRGFYTVSNEEC